MRWWTTKEEKELRALWLGPLTTAQMVPIMNRSKGSIIGHAHLMGLPSRGHLRADSAARARHAAKAKPPAPAKAPSRPARHVPLAQGTSTCMWVFGERYHYRYCGAPTLPGTAWCAEHVVIVYPRLLPYASPLTPRCEAVVAHSPAQTTAPPAA